MSALQAVVNSLRQAAAIAAKKPMLQLQPPLLNSHLSS